MVINTDKLDHLRIRKKKDLSAINKKRPFNSKTEIVKVDYRVCRKCKKLWHFELFRKYYAGWPAIDDSRRLANCKRCESAYQKESKKIDPARRLFKLARSRARKKKLQFNITIEYLNSIWPRDNLCPITRNEFKDGKGNEKYWASLDRVDNNLGYLKGNVAIISNEANEAKSDIDFNLLDKIRNFCLDFKKNNKVDFTDADNPENVMSRWELSRKNYKKYVETFGYDQNKNLE